MAGSWKCIFICGFVEVSLHCQWLTKAWITQHNGSPGIPLTSKFCSSLTKTKDQTQRHIGAGSAFTSRHFTALSKIYSRLNIMRNLWELQPIWTKATTVHYKTKPMHGFNGEHMWFMSKYSLLFPWYRKKFKVEIFGLTFISWSLYISCVTSWSAVVWRPD